MSVPFLDLTRVHRPLRPEIQAALEKVLDSGQFILGPETQALEAAIASLTGAGHAAAVASGTDAILLALLALDVGPGDEVVTTPFTFMATAGAIARTGARPVFADIDPATWHLDPGAAEAAVTERTRAILPVDLYGLVADYGRFEAIGRGRGLAVVEDAAQSIGAERDGRRSGSFGDAAAFSFYPTKNLGGMGDGGILTSRREEVAARVRLLRAHGDAGGYDHREIGMNSRLDAFQAVVLKVKLARLEGWNAERRRLADRYTALLSKAFDAPPGARVGAGGPPLAPPAPPPAGAVPTWHQYVVRAERRPALMEHLKARGIGCSIYYPVPLHLQPCFRELGWKKGSFPETERAAAEVLALPIYPGLEAPEQEEVVAGLASFYGVRA